MLPFVPIGDRCLFVHESASGSWYEMRAFCQGLGSYTDMAVVDDANLLGEIVDFIYQNGKIPSGFLSLQ